MGALIGILVIAVLAWYIVYGNLSTIRSIRGTYRDISRARAEILERRREGADPPGRGMSNGEAVEEARRLFRASGLRLHSLRAGQVVSDEGLPVTLALRRGQLALLALFGAMLVAGVLAFFFRSPSGYTFVNAIPIPNWGIQLIILGSVWWVHGKLPLTHWLESWSTKLTITPETLRIASARRDLEIPHDTYEVILSPTDQSYRFELVTAEDDSRSFLSWLIPKANRPGAGALPTVVAKAIEHGGLTVTRGYEKM